MKVKSILNAASSTRINIMVPRTDGNLYDFDIDYGRDDNEKVYDGWIKLCSCYGVPEKVLNAKVEMISTNHATSALVIYAKGVEI